MALVLAAAGAVPAATGVEAAKVSIAMASSPAASAPAPVPTPANDFDIGIEDVPAGFPDPFERFNRRTFAFNRRVDRWVIAPVSRTYGFLVPRPVKAGVRNLLFNLESPVRLVNDVLQTRWGNAGKTIARFAINSVVGIGGLFDPAAAFGIPSHDADFGQTLAARGVGSGPFLVLPVLGPTTVRDGLGAIVDTVLSPTTYLAAPLFASPLLSAGIGTSASGIVEREQHDRDLRRLEEGATDFYAALRSAYYQNRMAEIRRGDGAADPEGAVDGSQDGAAGDSDRGGSAVPSVAPASDAASGAAPAR